MDWVSDLSFPLSLMMALIVFSGVLLVEKYWRDKWVYRILTDWKLCVSVILACAVSLAVEGTWSVKLHKSPLFLCAALLFMSSSLLAGLDAIREKKRISFILSHLGVFVIFSGTFFSAPDFEDARIRLDEGGEVSNLAYSVDGYAVPLDFKLGLEDFQVDRYDDGVSPKQYRSILKIDGVRYETSVNSPCRYKGWMIYQNSFGEGYTVLGLVRDPWLPLIFFGMALMALGAVLSMRSIWNEKWVTPLVIALAAVFALLSLAKVNMTAMMPALRSLWFLPHLMIYMLAYSLLAVSAVLGALSWKRPELWDLSFRFLNTASALLLAGMLCGAVWAKYAWGDFWTWDAKECWAAATWLLTLAATHYRSGRFCGRKLVVFTVLAFLAMQVTWYGVKYLPSSKLSLHTYQTK